MKEHIMPESWKSRGYRMKIIKRIVFVILAVIVAALYSYGIWPRAIYNTDIGANSYENTGALSEGAVLKQSFVCSDTGLCGFSIKLTKQDSQTIGTYKWVLTEAETDKKVAEGKIDESSTENMIRYVNDIAGIRISCSFTSDIYLIADMISKQNDLTILARRDYMKNPKKSGYQSIHLIVGIPVTYLEKTKEIRVEIQIRSFAMDYWAELDNQMCYKKNAGQIENVERATKDYSDVIAKVDNQMLKLRRQIEKK